MELQCLTPFQYHFKYPDAERHYKELSEGYEQFYSSSDGSSVSPSASDYYSNCSVS